jgi:hypothetical protein
LGCRRPLGGPVEHGCRFQWIGHLRRSCWG